MSGSSSSSSSSSSRAADCVLYVVAVAMAEGIGREIATSFAPLVNRLDDPALRIGVETAIACVPLAALHVPLLKRVARPTPFALVLLVFALAVADGAGYRAAAFVDPALSALAGGAVTGIAFASVVERHGVVATIVAAALGALGMLARSLVLSTFGSRALVAYTAALIALWIPLGLYAYFGARERRAST